LKGGKPVRYAKTEWGVKVKIFSQRHGITLKQISAAAGVKNSTLLQVIVGKTPGLEVVEKVSAFMENYEATNKPRYLVTPFPEEVKL
jgi:predicted transcriptional regulator